MAAPYIPAKDSLLALWSANFAALILANPATYGLTPTDAGVIDAANTTWINAYTLVANPATKTKPVVADKDAARAAFLATARPYAIQIRNNNGVSNMAKSDLGLTIPDLTPTPVPAPTTFPVLSVRQATPGVHLLSYQDSNAPTPKSKAKPPGAIGLELWRGVGTAPAIDPAQCAYYGTVTIAPFKSVFDVADEGKVATYFGRWITRGRAPGGDSALTGDWSAPVSFTIAF